MPLYEMILIMKIGETHSLGSLMKSISTHIYKNGGVVRQFRNLSDRIAPKLHKSKDGYSSNVVRYLSIELNADPLTLKTTEYLIKSHMDIFQYNVFKLNEKEYHKNIMNEKYFNLYEPNVQKDPNDFIAKNTAKEIFNKINNNKTEDEIDLEFHVRSKNSDDTLNKRI